jgi:hypothetical protein
MFQCTENEPKLQQGLLYCVPVLSPSRHVVQQQPCIEIACDLRPAAAAAVIAILGAAAAVGGHLCQALVAKRDAKVTHSSKQMR